MAAFDPTPSRNVWLVGYTEPHRQVLFTGVPSAWGAILVAKKTAFDVMGFGIRGTRRHTQALAGRVTRLLLSQQIWGRSPGRGSRSRSVSLGLTGDPSLLANWFFLKATILLQLFMSQRIAICTFFCHMLPGRCYNRSSEC
jgi:hypothetical protein